MRLQIMGLALILAACGGGQTATETAPASGPELLPQQVQQLTERLRTCRHLAGELGGGDAARDREVTAAMAQWRCEQVDADVAAMRQQYADHRRALQSLDEADREVDAEQPEAPIANTPEFGAETAARGRLPADVADFIGRWEHCMHLAGEFGGDGSARDGEVSAAMGKLGCDRLESELLALRHQYRAHAEVLQALEDAQNSAEH